MWLVVVTVVSETVLSSSVSLSHRQVKAGGMSVSLELLVEFCRDICR